MMQEPSSAVLRALEARARESVGWSGRRVLRAACLVALLVLLAASARLAQVDLGRLIEGLPKLGHWLDTAWPLKLD